MLAAPVSPNTGPRVKAEAQGNYERNKGCLGLFFNQEANKQYNSPRPAGRCPSGAAREQLEKHRGQMGNWLDESKNKEYESPRPVARCPSAAAREQMEKHKGCMDSMMGGYPSMPPSRKVHARAVKPEAGGNAKAHSGGATKSLFENYGHQKQSAQPQPRVKSEAEENFFRNKGSMSTIFGDSRGVYSQPKPEPRVKPEAANNAELNKGNRASKILCMMPPSSR
ncbi:uncharacterized protein LOC141905340 [Tubulanus polymorphus]|uniref:uncharacterized protein LOC141905340 n=1 Tax=Tubulanus polymorphus TaxID=672921 RepID=UPI003DA63CCA